MDKAGTLFHLVAKAWQHARAASGRMMWINLLLTLFQGILPLLFLYLMKLLVDEAVQVEGISGGEKLRDIFILTLLCGGVFLLNGWNGALLALVREQQSSALSARMHALLHQKAGALPLAFFEDPRYHDLFFRASAGASFRPARIVNGLFQLMQSTLSLAGLAVLLFYLHWSIALALVLSGLPALYFRLRHAREHYRWNKRKTPSERRLQYYHRILSTEAFARELRVFGHGKHISKRFAALFQTLRQEGLAQSKKKTSWDMLSHLFASAVIFGILLWSVSLVAGGGLSAGTLVLYFLAFQRGAGFLKDLTNSLGGLYDDNLYMKDLDEFLSLGNKTAREPRPADVRFGPPSGIVVEDLCFTYPGSERPALKHVSFRLEPGSFNALVGTNGAGKSSLVKLLCGLYLPDSGSIRVDGEDTRNWPSEALRNRFSVLFQDFVLYYLTAGENIWFGDTSIDYDEKKLTGAARMAGADTLVESLSMGYNTVLGKVLDGTRQLSMGEWQKIALARAFYRDRPYLLLDEPGSALDPLAEAHVLLKFKELTKGKTALVVSHRMNFTRQADQVLLLDKAALIGCDKHETLLRENQLYASFHRDIH